MWEAGRTAIARTPADAAPPPLAPAVRSRSTWLLVALRTAYAYNWFDIGPALPGIGREFSVGPGDWGLLVASFLLGAGLLQVPAGLLARRLGARPVALAGAGLLAVGGIASALAPSFAALLLSRLLAGAGAGLFFSPAIGLVGSLFPPGERGLPVGVFSSAFSGGAAAGVFATAVAVPLVGWRMALTLGAVGLGVLTVAATAAIPASVGAAAPRPARVPPSVPVALRLRGVWAIGLAFVGLEGATFATGQFVVPFGESIHGWSAAVAGAVGTSFVLPSVVGGPFGGVIAERGSRPRLALVVATALGAGALVAMPFAGLAATVAIGCLFSFAYGFVYAVMYVLPHRWAGLPSEEIPLAIGLFNAIQLGGGALVSLGFGYVVALHSYALAWPLVAAVQVALLAALLALPALDAAGRPPSEAAAPR